MRYQNSLGYVTNADVCEATKEHTSMVMNMNSDEYFKMEFDTTLLEEECKVIIDRENTKDIEQAIIISAILEGKTNELSFLRRKVAGQFLHQFQKLTLSVEKREYLIYNFKQRVANGSETFISYNDGKLVVQFDEFGRMGSDFLGRVKNAEKKLMKRFKATGFRYLPKENKDGGQIVNESKDDAKTD